MNGEYTYSGVLNEINLRLKDTLRAGATPFVRGCGTTKGWAPCVTCHAEYGSPPCHRHQMEVAEKDEEPCYVYYRFIEIMGTERDEEDEIIVTYRAGHTYL